MRRQETDLNNPLCSFDDIPEGGGKGFALSQCKHIFATRKGNSVYIYRNNCPHKGLPLNLLPDRFLDRDRQYILCSAHGALFEISSGLCIAGPCTGSSLKPVAHIVEDRQIFIADWNE